MKPGTMMLIAALALAGSLSGCGLHGKPRVERRSPPAAGPMPVNSGPTEVLEPGTVVSPGIVEPWGSQTELSAQEPGWIAEIAVREGEPVRAGQLLAALDDGTQRHAVDLARAELAEAEAAFARIERGATPEEMRQAEADFEAAAARRDFVVAAEARTARLHGEGMVADNDADRAATDRRAQTALAKRSQARLAELRRGARPEDRAAARARVAAARARLGLAEANLVRRRVFAPAAATVLLSRFHPGEFYDPARGALFVLGDVTRLQVRMEVDEIDAAAFGRGATSTIYSDGGARLTEGTVVRLAPRMGRRVLPIESPTARADVRVREVFVEIPGGTRLIPGQRVWGHTPRIPAPPRT